MTVIRIGTGVCPASPHPKKNGTEFPGDSQLNVKNNDSDDDTKKQKGQCAHFA